MRSHLKKHLYSCLGWILATLDMPIHVCVCWCVYLPCLCVSHQSREREDCCTEVKDYIWECLTSQSSSEWPSAAPLSSPYLRSRGQNENTCHSYLEMGLKILTDTRNWRKKVSRSVTWGYVWYNRLIILSLLAHFLLFFFVFFQRSRLFILIFIQIWCPFFIQDADYGSLQ